MGLFRGVRAALGAVVAVLTLTFAANAGAAAWQGPVLISEPTVTAAANPTIALGGLGHAVAAWWDDANGGRIALARRPPGGTWSTPVTIATGVSATPLFPAVDAVGNSSVAFSSGGVTLVATWLAPEAVPTLATIPGPELIIGGFAVNRVGDAVLAGWAGSPAALTVAYRLSGHPFEVRTYPSADIVYPVTSARVAISVRGVAAVIFRANTLRAIFRTSQGDWPVVPEEVAPFLMNVQDSDLDLGIDFEGNTYAAFTYTVPGSATVLRTALRPAAGGWQQSPDLSAATAPSEASSVTLRVMSSGPAALVWLQSAGGVKSVKARYGATTTNAWGPSEDVSDAGASDPVAAIGGNGTVVAAWEQATVGGNVGQGRARTPGAAGVWGDVRPLTAGHPNVTDPSISADDLGDFATVSAPYDGTYRPVKLSFYDAAPPAFTGPLMQGSTFAGDEILLSTAATDAWSTAGTPVWTFGDGATASGSGVAHTWDTPGTYTMRLSVTDSAGNTSAYDQMLAFGDPRSTLTSAKFSARWKQSRVTGTLIVRGSVPLAATYSFDVLKGKVRKLHFAVKLTGPDFSRTIRLPATFLPGTYRVVLDPSPDFLELTELEAKLAAPAEGVVDVKKLSATRTGKPVRTLRASRSVFASFHFAVLPKGTLRLTWYRTYKGKKTTLKSATRKPVAKVADSLALRGRQGTITAVLTRSGKIIAQGSVKAS
jgi:hypothetical protein